MSHGSTAADWNQRYIEGTTPWDSGLPSAELVRVLDQQRPPPGRALELGCGTGTNAVYLARRGFDVTAIDLSEVALEQARRRAAAAHLRITFQAVDLVDWHPGRTFDLVFDRGCYHCVRRTNPSGYLAALARATHAGSRCLLLVGNANEQTGTGPPRMHEHEIRAELAPLFAVDFIRPFRFEDPGGVPGPLGWSCWIERRADHAPPSG